MSVKHFEKIALQDMANLTSKSDSAFLNVMVDHLNLAQNYCINIHKREFYQIIISLILDNIILDHSALPASLIYFHGNIERIESLQHFIKEPVAIVNKAIAPIQNSTLKYDDAIQLQSMIRGLISKNNLKKSKMQIDFSLRTSIPYKSAIVEDDQHLIKVYKTYSSNKLKMNQELQVLEERISNIEIPLYLTKLWIEFRLWYMKVEKETKSFPTAEQVDHWLSADLLIIENDILAQSFKDFDYKPETKSDKESDLEFNTRLFLQYWPLDKLDEHWNLGHSKYLLYATKLKSEIEKCKNDLPMKLKEDLQAAITESIKDLKGKKPKKEKKAKKPKGEKIKKLKDPTGGWTIDQMLEELGKLGILRPLAKNKNSILFFNNGEAAGTISEFYLKSVKYIQWPLLAKNEVKVDTIVEQAPTKSKKDSKAKVAPVAEPVIKKVGVNCLLYGKDHSLMLNYCEKIAYNSSALFLMLVPSQMKGLYEDPIELSKLFYMIFTVAKSFSPAIIIVDEADMIFAKKLKNCDFNPKRFKKELVKQTKGIKPIDHVQIIGLSTCPNESDIVGLSNYFNNLVSLPRVRLDEIICRLDQLKGIAIGVDLAKYKDKLYGSSYEGVLEFEDFVKGHPSEELISNYAMNIEKIDWTAYDCLSKSN